MDEDMGIRRFADQSGLIEAVMQSVPDGILTVSGDHKIASCNQAAEALFRWDAGELIGRSLDDLIPDIVRGRHSGLVAGYLENEHETHRKMTDRIVKGVRKDGTVFSASVSLGKFQIGGQMNAVATIRDVTELERKTIALEELSDELQARTKAAEDASRAKSRFLASMSHELRTPLNAIIGFSELTLTLQEDKPGRDQEREYLGHIYESGRHLLSLVNDLLELSSTQLLPSDLQEIALPVLVDQVVAQFQSDARAKSLSLTSRVPEGLSVKTDRKRVRQILTNLVSNAVKYTDSGSVTVTAERVGPDITVTVSDTGMGIDKADFEKIFEQFARLDSNVYAQNQDGAGIGLYLCNAMAHALRGGISVESALGKGSAFTLRLPNVVTDDDDLI